MEDRYLYTEQQVQRLITDWIKHGSIIVAYDFDNTVFDYHQNGDTYKEVIEQLQMLGHMGCTMICFTSCDESRYPEIRRHLISNGIPCHGINIDSSDVPYRGRKIYYNVFYDDRSGLGQVYDVMFQVIEKIKEIVYQENSNLPLGECVYSGQKFTKGEWIFENKFPAAFNRNRKEFDLIPSIEKILRGLDSY
jgi:hypothetical protein